MNDIMNDIMINGMDDLNTPAPEKKPLNEKRLRFCEEYLRLGSAKEAAAAAGYSAKTSRTLGSWLLGVPEIKAHIAELRKELASPRIAEVTEILEFLTSLMRGEMVEQVPLLCGKGFQQLVGKQVGAKERLDAAKLLGKRYAIFSERVALEGAVPVVITGEDQLE